MSDIHPIAEKFTRNFKLTPAENDAVVAIRILRRTIDANQNIVREGDTPSHCVIILAGLAGTSKIEDGGKRQVTAFHVPGDMPDLMSLHLEVLDSDIRSVSKCEVAFVEHRIIRELCEHHPRLAAALWRATLVDASIYREWVVNVGSRPAINRVAHLFCEIFRRMDWCGLVENRMCAFRLTQADLSEATGLSIVHINRTLQAIRQAGLITFSEGTLAVHNWMGLAELGGFTDDYLHLRRSRSLN